MSRDTTRGAGAKKWPRTLRLDPDNGQMVPGAKDGTTYVQSKNTRLIIDRAYYEARNVAALDTLVENPRIEVTVADDSGAFIEDCPIGAVAGTKQFPQFFRVEYNIEPSQNLAVNFHNLSAGITFDVVLVLEGYEERVS